MSTHLRRLLVFTLLTSSVCLGADWEALALKLRNNPNDAWPEILSELTSREFQFPRNEEREIISFRWILRQVASNVGSKAKVQKKVEKIIQSLDGSRFPEVGLIRYRTAMAIRPHRPEEAKELLQKGLKDYQALDLKNEKYGLEKASIRLALLQFDLRDGIVKRNKVKSRLKILVREAIQVFRQPDGYTGVDDATSDILRIETVSKSDRLREFLKRAVKVGRTEENTQMARKLLESLEKVKDWRSYMFFNVARSPLDGVNRSAIQKERDSQKKGIEHLKEVLEFERLWSKEKVAQGEPEGGRFGDIVRKMVASPEKVDWPAFAYFEFTNPKKRNEQKSKSWIPWFDALIEFGEPALAEKMGDILRFKGETHFGLETRVVKALLAQRKFAEALERLTRILVNGNEVDAKERFEHLESLRGVVAQVEDRTVALKYLEGTLSAAQQGARNRHWLKQNWSSLAQFYQDLANIYRESNDTPRAIVALRQSVYLTTRYASSDSDEIASRKSQLKHWRKSLGWKDTCLDAFGARRGVPSVINPLGLW